LKQEEETETKMKEKYLKQENNLRNPVNTLLLMTRVKNGPECIVIQD